MDTNREIEILSFLAYGDHYGGPTLKDMDFTKEELNELDNAEYITCINLVPLKYKITIKGSKHFKKIAKKR